MKVLILGADGMLGHKIYSVLKAHHETFVTLRTMPDSGIIHNLFANVAQGHLYTNVNALQIESVSKVLEEVQPEVVLNCIGIVKQRGEAKSAVPSITVNALFPHQLADMCKLIGARLIHFSTDCVFSGHRGHYTEADIPDPVDLYGQTKLLGELSQPHCLTLRTSIIGWELKTHSGLLEWFATQRGKQIKGYRGAIYTGFSTATMARLVEKLLNNYPELWGIYQVASQPITKYDLLLKLQDALGWHDITVMADDVFQCDRSLNGERFEAQTAWQPPTWDEMITELASEWRDYEKWRI